MAFVTGFFHLTCFQVHLHWKHDQYFIPFYDQWHSTVWIYHVLFILSPADGHSGGFHIWAIMKNAVLWASLLRDIYFLE